jgi:hypothetical protein
VPTTLLIDHEGNEIGRLLGPAEWDSPEMVAFIRGYVEWQSGAPLGRASEEVQIALGAVRPVARLGLVETSLQRLGEAPCDASKQAHGGRPLPSQTLPG